MNKEELRKLIIDNSNCLPEDNKEDFLDEFEFQIRLETLKDVLPKEKKLSMLFGVDESRVSGYNYCRKEIINKAKENWNIIL